jgi:hypothetical protein
MKPSVFNFVNIFSFDFSFEFFIIEFTAIASATVVIIVAHHLFQKAASSAVFHALIASTSHIAHFHVAYAVWLIHHNNSVVMTTGLHTNFQRLYNLSPQSIIL